jgi:DNA repair exonuclease SbcCD ATPase subunit
MISRNDPERLEAEAKELLEQYSKAAQGTLEETEASPEQEDTLKAEEQFDQEAPESTDTAETDADEAPQEEQERGEDSETRTALEKAEKAMKGAQARMTRATQEAAELKRQNADLFQALTELKGQLVDKERDNEKLQQLREEYPDVAGPLLDELQRTQDEVRSTQDTMKAQEQRQFEEVKKQSVAEHFARIEAIHPDVSELTQTSDWALWLEEQDGQTQQWIESGSSNDVNTVLNNFKEYMGIRPPTPQERALERAKGVAEPRLPKARKQNVNGDKKTWSVDDIMRMPNQEFEKHQREILKAMETGSIRR